MDKTERGLAVAVVVLIVAAFVVPDWLVFLGTLSLARALVVLGLLVLWRTGLISFGQGLFFAIGGYATGLLGLYYHITDAVVLTLVGMALSVIVAFIVGFFIARYRDIFFAMLSLAVSMILYGALVKTEALGSTDGFNVEPPTFLGYAPQEEAMGPALFIFALLVSVFAAISVHRYLQTTLGSMTTAIRDNEIRVEYLGISPVRVIQWEYVLAGMVAGAGGVLNALAVGHVDPEMAYWTTSGEFVFVTILSGTGSVAAPLIGSFLFEVVRTYATDYSPYTWQMVLGGTLLLLILFLPDGLWSLYQRLRTRGAR